MPRRALVVLPALAVAAGLAMLFLWDSPPADPAREAAFLEPLTAWVTDLDRSESVHDEASRDLRASFLKGLAVRDRSLAASGLTDDFLGRFPEPGAGTAVPGGPFRIRQYSPAEIPPADREAFLATLWRHLDGLVSIERTTWRVFEFLLDPRGARAQFRAHFQVAGPKPDEGRADLQATVRGELARADGAWRLRRLALEEGWRAESDRPPFEDITEQSGFTLTESAENRRLRQAIVDERGVSMLGGLTVADFDGDGFQDALATVVQNENVLLMNDGKGGFVRAPPPVLDDRRIPFAFLRIDLDGDGAEELVSTHVLAIEGSRARAALYTRRGDAWELRPDALPFEVAPGTGDLMFLGVVPGDVDRDGDHDLFFCGYRTRDSGGASFNRISAHDGADNLLFINHGGLRFTEESDARGISGTQYTYVAKIWDFDFDGDPDLFEGNDFGENVLWLNDGKGRFAEAKGHVFAEGPNYTMGVSIADWDNTGAWSMAISNMYSHAGNRIVPLVGGISEEMRRVGKVLAQGNQLYECDPATREWRETGVARGVNWADWAWACAFFDADNDRDLDMFVANGFASHSDRSAPDF
jgi:hypothetical protein